MLLAKLRSELQERLTTTSFVHLHREDVLLSLEMDNVAVLADDVLRAEQVAKLAGLARMQVFDQQARGRELVDIRVGKVELQVSDTGVLTLKCAAVLLLTTGPVLALTQPPCTRQ